MSRRRNYVYGFSNDQAKQGLSGGGIQGKITVKNEFARRWETWRSHQARVCLDHSTYAVWRGEGTSSIYWVGRFSNHGDTQDSEARCYARVEGNIVWHRLPITWQSIDFNY